MGRSGCRREDRPRGQAGTSYSSVGGHTCLHVCTLLVQWGLRPPSPSLSSLSLLPSNSWLMLWQHPPSHSMVLSRWAKKQGAIMVTF